MHRALDCPLVLLNHPNHDGHFHAAACCAYHRLHAAMSDNVASDQHKGAVSVSPVSHGGSRLVRPAIMDDIHG